jgi:hypothetical protein
MVQMSCQKVVLMPMEQSLRGSVEDLWRAKN